MPAKKKGGKAKDAGDGGAAPAAKGEAAYSTDEMKQMRVNLRLMKQETINEKKLLNDFQQQKEKIEKFWTMEKKKRDDLKMLFRNKLRQKQDLEEKHAFELKVYKQKVKHLLHEQKSHMTDVRYDGEVALKLLSDEQRERQHELDLNLRSIKVVRKDMELAHYDLIKSIKVQQEKKVMALRQEFERKSKDLKDNYEKKFKTVRETCDEKRKEDIARIEAKKAKHIQTLMQKHKAEFEKIKSYYRDTSHGNLDLIKTLKEEVGDMKKKEQGVQKEVSDISRLNKKLTKPLQKNRKLLEDLKRKLDVYQNDLVKLADSKDQLVVLEEHIKNLSWEQEIQEQKFSRMKEERDELKNRLHKTIYNVQQKTGFKNLLLEKKLEAMSQDLEKTESALAEVLASTNLQPEVIGDIKHNLEDVLMAKNKQVQRLEDNLADLKHSYSKMIQVYEAKMAEHNVPLEELGFTPVRRF
mmetsp:Transcript_26219/g.37282  ORF Transcript_26219/g.37282 Transcript_26219/m.37282 type:complete len:466 (+) Transcript_26219:13-1410(+)